MNLKRGFIMVPGENNNWVSVQFPGRAEFDRIYSYGVRAKTADRNYDILRARAQGKTLQELAEQFGVTQQRIRQIEQGFIRLIRRDWFESKPSSDSVTL